MSDNADAGWIEVRYRHSKAKDREINLKGPVKVPTERFKSNIPKNGFRASTSPYRQIRPIMSYGAIVFTVRCNEDGIRVPYFLVAQRRDTIEYVDFLRGNYEDSILPIFFNLMSTTEKERMQTYPFDELWNDLWINKDHKICRNSYFRAKQKFTQIQDKIGGLISCSENRITCPPWGFPKGKKNIHETPLNCALREFTEETRINLKQVDFELVCFRPLFEFYNGSNSKKYGTQYFIIFVPEKLAINKMIVKGRIRTSTISEETGDLKWLEFDEMLSLLNSRRQKLVETVKKIIKDNGYI